MHPRHILLPALVGTAALAQSPVYHQYTWPAISAFTFTKELDATAELVDFSFPVRDPQNRVVYTFRGLGGTEAGLDRLGAAEGEEYAGDFSFHLYEGDSPTGSSLLGYDGSAYWFTRAQVRYLLGTPMVPGGFDNDRWDYDYYLKLRQFKHPRQARAAVYFKNDQVDHVDSDVMPVVPSRMRPPLV